MSKNSGRNRHHSWILCPKVGNTTQDRKTDNKQKKEERAETDQADPIRGKGSRRLCQSEIPSALLFLDSFVLVKAGMDSLFSLFLGQNVSIHLEGHEKVLKCPEGECGSVPCLKHRPRRPSPQIVLKPRQEFSLFWPDCAPLWGSPFLSSHCTAPPPAEPYPASSFRTAFCWDKGGLFSEDGLNPI